MTEKTVKSGRRVRGKKTAAGGRPLSVLAWLLATAVATGAVAARAGETVLTAVEDVGMLDGDDRNDPFPGIVYSELETLAAGNVWLSLIKFDLSALNGVSIGGARFELTANFNHSADGFLHEVYSSSDDDWSEDVVTGVSRPTDATLTLLDTIEIDGANRAYSWDVRSAVIGEDGLAGDNRFLTLLIRPKLSQAGGAGFGPHFNDRSSPTGFPRLVIDGDPRLLPIFENSFE